MSGPVARGSGTDFEVLAAAMAELVQAVRDAFVPVVEAVTQVMSAFVLAFGPSVDEHVIRYGIEQLGISDVDIRRVEFVGGVAHVRLWNHRVLECRFEEVES